jgi:hypothetical protein
MDKKNLYLIYKIISKNKNFLNEFIKCFNAYAILIILLLIMKQTFFEYFRPITKSVRLLKLCIS